jgi:hypothetical protein
MLPLLDSAEPHLKEDQDYCQHRYLRRNKKLAIAELLLLTPSAVGLKSSDKITKLADFQKLQCLSFE